MAYYRDIPVEVTTEILSRMPVKSLHRFKCVCKSWKNLIESHDFCKHHLFRSLKINSTNFSLILTTWHTTLHINDTLTLFPFLNRAYLDCNDIDNLDINRLILPPSFQPSPDKISRGNYGFPCKPRPKKVTYGRIDIAGSCHGLVLVLCGTHHAAVCNPSINDLKHSSFWKILPTINFNSSKHNTHDSTYVLNLDDQPLQRDVVRTFQFMIFGFGYDIYSHCYKVVCFTPGNALIYNLSKGNPSWRMIDLPELELASEFEQDINDYKLYIQPHNHGVVVNNHLHWNITEYDPQIFEYSKETILTFNLHNEVWGTMPVPEPEELYQGYFMKGFIVKPYILELGVLNGCLCLLMSRGISSTHLGLWIMKEYGVEESWTKVCNVPNGSGIPVAYRVETQEYLLPGAQYGLGWYNPKSKRINKVGLHGCGCTGGHHYSTRVKICIESFATPRMFLTETSEKIYQLV
ncbi:F-box protein CPR30-like [Chenopodium quinoa]|uniref:F-box domain-containing protein n=1 Tax=Chenopodium quinoa TaxID=63459 RepID=A0A803MQD5_CHEQI|nr:F-box protein CPR30-like [Chenopodium quinoa]